MSKNSRKGSNGSNGNKGSKSGKGNNVVVVGKKMGKIEWEARFVVGKLRRGSSITRNDMLNCLGSIGRSMQRFGLNTIKDIKPSHVVRYFAELNERGLSAGRMANHATAMRMLCKIMGKSDIVPSNSELGCSRSVANRTKNADVRENSEKSAEARSRLSENHQIAYGMARQFGLRQKEALLSNTTIHRDGSDFLVVAGAKGGRPRQVPISTAEQRAVVAWNIAYRTSHGGTLINAKKSLKQGIKELQNELAAAGATRTSGANMHALRREWIIEGCHQILAAPEGERQKMIENLVESVGHGREEVIRAYTRLLG
jgi:site-specific recombinase XerC